MNLNDCFERARIILKGLNYPLGDLITPLEDQLGEHVNSHIANYFSINFHTYLMNIGVLSKTEQGDVVNIKDLDALDFDLYKAYLKNRRQTGLLQPSNPLHKLLQECL